jgi:hypothetical protein
MTPIYRRLKEGGHEIRLIHIEPLHERDSPDALLQCHLHYTMVRSDEEQEVDYSNETKEDDQSGEEKEQLSSSSGGRQVLPGLIQRDGHANYWQA